MRKKHKKKQRKTYADKTQTCICIRNKHLPAYEKISSCIRKHNIHADKEKFPHTKQNNAYAYEKKK